MRKEGKNSDSLKAAGNPEATTGREKGNNFVDRQEDLNMTGQFNGDQESEEPI